MTPPPITGERGHCVFSQRALCGHCTGIVRALCGHCARAWNAVLSVQAGPSKTCSLPFPAPSMGFSLYEASRQSHRHMHRMLSFVMGSTTKKGRCLRRVRAFAGRPRGLEDGRKGCRVCVCSMVWVSAVRGFVLVGLRMLASSMSGCNTYREYSTIQFSTFLTSRLEVEVQTRSAPHLVFSHWMPPTHAMAW